MTIHIEELSFDVIIGLLDFERVTPQRVIIEVEVDYKYKNNQFINYADMVTLIQKHLDKQKYELLEDAIIGLKEVLIKKYPKIKTIFIKISKPNILENCIVSLSQSWNL